MQFSESKDGLGQQYSTPSDVVGTKLSDVIIVGRGVYKANDPKSEAIKYQEAGWKSYVERLGK